MIIETIKEQVSLIEVAEKYTDLLGKGNRLRAKENPIREGGDLDFFQDTEKYYDQGTGEGGDVIDFIQIVENLDKHSAIEFLKENYIGEVSSEQKARPLPKPRYKPIKKDNELLLARVDITAKKYLSALPPRNTNGRFYQKYSSFVLEYGSAQNAVSVAPIFEKLFEGSIIPTEEKFASYIFNKVIGYNSYFNCPVIVVRDESETVVNLISYRPERDGEPLLQNRKPLKYLNLKSEDTPDSSYIFPLQAQMQKIMANEGYCFVGEGLKNSINASMMGIPFVSIEGAANIKPELIEFLKSPRMADITMVGAFDGDQAGETAYEKMIEQIPMPNNFKFDSGTDFTDYIKEIRVCQLETE